MAACAQMSLTVYAQCPGVYAHCPGGYYSAKVCMTVYAQVCVTVRALNRGAELVTVIKVLGRSSFVHVVEMSSKSKPTLTSSFHVLVYRTNHWRLSWIHEYNKIHWRILAII